MLIQGHNKRTLRNIEKFERKITETDKSLCNCRDKNQWPLEIKCLTKNIIYKATVTTKNEIKQYIGSTGGPFKMRWYGYVRDFKVHKGNGSELSKFVWKLKINNIDYKIKLDILHRIGELKNPQSLPNYAYE